MKNIYFLLGLTMYVSVLFGSDLSHFSNDEFSASLSITFTKSDAPCFGLPDGRITANPSGGVSPYTFMWSNGATTNVNANIAAGTYTVTVTDAGGTTAVASESIGQSLQIQAAITPSQPACFGGSDGALTANVSGGVGPYSYNWSTGATTTSINNLAAAAYTLTVTDAVNCTRVFTANLSQPNPLSLNPSKSDVFCNGDSTGRAEVDVSGAIFPYSYLWSNGSTNDSISGLIAGTYTVTVTDANACTDSLSINVDQTTVIIGNIITTPTSCFGNNDGVISANPSGGLGPYAFLWSTGDTSNTINGLAAGVYVLTITDALGCAKVFNRQVNRPTILSLTTMKSDVFCHGDSSGWAKANPAGGTAPFSFQWSNGGVNDSIGGIVAGMYSVTVTDVNGCTDTASVRIDQPTAIIGNIITTPTSCFASSDGSISANPIGGLGPYAFLWSTGDTTTSISGLAAGSYVLSITDALGCTKVFNRQVNRPGLLNLTTMKSDVFCHGDSSGWAKVNVSGGTAPYSYLWSNANTNDSISGLMAGVYTVTVTDANACTDTISVRIDQLPAIQVSINTTATSCFGGNDGALNTTASGGLGPYAYLWSNGDTLSAISGLQAGNYNLTLTDAAGCVKVYSAQVNQPSPINTAVTQTGSVLNASLTNATYQWLDCDNAYAPISGATAQSYTVLANGNYAVEVTDGACMDTSNCVNVVLVGLNESIGASDQLMVYPNPSSGLFTCSLLQSKAEAIELRIFDLKGGLLMEKVINSNEALIDLSEWEKGIYLINLMGYTRKLILVE